MEINDSKTSFIRSDKFFPSVNMSFPSITYKQYQRINNGKNFDRWVWGENDDGKIIACAAIFRGYKIGVLCVHPDYRRQGIGTTFYSYLVSQYYPLEWTAITEESIKFYNKMGAVNKGLITKSDGKTYTIFNSK